MTSETEETVRADHVWMRDGKPWAPPESWQAVYDAVCEYGAKPDHMYTDVERIVAANAFDLTDAVVAALADGLIPHGQEGSTPADDALGRRDRSVHAEPLNPSETNHG